MNKLLICLTGGIASGKTRVSDRFLQWGGAVIDTDVLARQVVQPGTPGLLRLIEHFGPGILTDNGALDRAALKQLIFQDEAARLAVNQILHPLIWAAGLAQSSQSNKQLEMWVIPLFHPGIDQIEFDRVLVVDVDPKIQIQRIMQRDGIDRSMAQAIMGTQLSREDRLQLASDVLVNNGTLEQLDEKAHDLYHMYQHMAVAAG
ncbi:dephospho-CoA kinase [Marinicella meishanensis]|uniref:dephospho-CoA kinase n=1 Tax=Marinicella meishanensis TaxID=2873263 RepID=UPI001CBE65AA|nr:dephospho-CoA kinase [Marinicella sp. NBU2979]